MAEMLKFLVSFLGCAALVGVAAACHEVASVASCAAGQDPEAQADTQLVRLDADLLASVASTDAFAADSTAHAGEEQGHEVGIHHSEPDDIPEGTIVHCPNIDLHVFAEPIQNPDGENPKWLVREKIDTETEIGFPPPPKECGRFVATCISPFEEFRGYMHFDGGLVIAKFVYHNDTGVWERHLGPFNGVVLTTVASNGDRIIYAVRIGYTEFPLTMKVEPDDRRNLPSKLQAAERGAALRDRLLSRAGTGFAGGTSPTSATVDDAAFCKTSAQYMGTSCENQDRTSLEDEETCELAFNTSIGPDTVDFNYPVEYIGNVSDPTILEGCTCWLSCVPRDAPTPAPGTAPAANDTYPGLNSSNSGSGLFPGVPTPGPPSLSLPLGGLGSTTPSAPTPGLPSLSLPLGGLGGTTTTPRVIQPTEAPTEAPTAAPTRQVLQPLGGRPRMADARETRAGEIGCPGACVPGLTVQNGTVPTGPLPNSTLVCTHYCGFNSPTASPGDTIDGQLAICGTCRGGDVPTPSPDNGDDDLGGDDPLNDRPNASATGDPHLTNANRVSFDIRRPGNYTLVRVPRHGEPLLEMIGIIHELGHPCKLYITTVSFRGSLFGNDTVTVRAPRHNPYDESGEDTLFDLHFASRSQAIALRDLEVSDRETKLKTFQHADFSAAVKAVRQASTKEVAVEGRDSSTQGFVVIAAGKTTEPGKTLIKITKRRRWLNVAINHLPKLGFRDIAGALGTDRPLPDWMEPTEACKKQQEAATAQGEQKKLDALLHTL